MNKTLENRTVYYAQYLGNSTECTMFPANHAGKARKYYNITRSSKKRLSHLFARHAISQHAHVFPYVDVFVTFPPKGEM